MDCTDIQTVKTGKRVRLGVRRSARAHLTLARRQSWVGGLREVLPAAAKSLGEALQTKVTLSARLLDSVIRPATGLTRGSVFILVELSTAGTTAVLELEPPFLVSVLDRLSGGNGKPSPTGGLTRVEESACGFLALTALLGVREHGRVHALFGPRFAGLAYSRAEVLERLERDVPFLTLEIGMEVGTASSVARLLLPASAVQVTASAVPPEPVPSDIAPDVLTAGLTCRVFAGHSSLAGNEVDRLSRGDVVLFDDLRLDAGRLLGACRLQSSSFTLEGEFRAQGFHPHRAIPRAFPPEKWMTTDPMLTEEDLASLPVEVQVELSRLRIGLAELATLKPGTLLPLHINVSEPVLLRIGDRAVARAELVEIEGEVGARILSLLAGTGGLP